jgi:hypothetical protein
MLLEPIKLTLYDPETQEPIKEYQQQVITFEMLLAAVQLQEALAVLPAKKRRWWWQKSISQEVAQINAMMELVVCFFGNRFTVEELRRGAEVSEVMAVYRSILSRPKAIVSANPTIPPARRKRH